ncbi:hypothetical protein VNO77_27848 [Canavalia gladiata]|uniref:Secreted protein n=1 Tax=Canavalia gladiata TaxID=3824 RepID=A0AAN9KUR9_CANGL
MTTMTLLLTVICAAHTVNALASEAGLKNTNESGPARCDSLSTSAKKGKEKKRYTRSKLWQCASNPSPNSLSSPHIHCLQLTTYKFTLITHSPSLRSRSVPFCFLLLFLSR